MVISVGHVFNVTTSLRPLLLDPRQSEIDQIREDKQKRGKSQRLSKFSLARLQDDRRRQHPRLPTDIPAHHHRGADLRDHGTESGHERGQERQTCLPP